MTMILFTWFKSFKTSKSLPTLEESVYKLSANRRTGYWLLCLFKKYSFTLNDEFGIRPQHMKSDQILFIRQLADWILKSHWWVNCVFLNCASLASELSTSDSDFMGKR